MGSCPVGRNIEGARARVKHLERGGAPRQHGVAVRCDVDPWVGDVVGPNVIQSRAG